MTALPALPDLADLRRRFERDGYAVLPGFKSAAACAAAVARARALVDAFEPGAGTGVFSTRDRARVADAALLASARAVHCFFEEEAFDAQGRQVVDKARAINKIGHALHDLDPVFDAFSHGAELAAVGAAVGLAQPRVWQSQVIFKQPGIGGEVGWHQDASFFVTAPQTVTTFWFALEDADEGNGCLWAEPGGHRGPLRERFVREPAAADAAHAAAGAEADDTADTARAAGAGVERGSGGGGSDAGVRLRMQREPGAPPWPARDRALPLPVAAGTLVLFHGLLPHRSDANRSARSRIAYTLHATDASARYAASNWLQRDGVRGLA